jgi:hypothetical protein
MQLGQHKNLYGNKYRSSAVVAHWLVVLVVCNKISCLTDFMTQTFFTYFLTTPPVAASSLPYYSHFGLLFLGTFAVWKHHFYDVVIFFNFITFYLRFKIYSIKPLCDFFQVRKMNWFIAELYNNVRTIFSNEDLQIKRFFVVTKEKSNLDNFFCQNLQVVVTCLMLVLFLRKLG